MADSSPPLGLPSRALQLGDSGTEVAQWQQHLRSQGLNVSDPAGYFGADTKRATRHLQASLGVRRDGAVTPNTLAAIARSQPLPQPEPVIVTDAQGNRFHLGPRQGSAGSRSADRYAGRS